MTSGIKHLFLLITLGSSLSLISMAQTQNPPSDQSLLLEIHRLRVAVERMASTMPRMQITLQRMQMQEQRVAELSRQLKEVQSQSIRASAEQIRELSHEENLQERIGEEQDPIRRKMLQDELAATKNNPARAAQIAQQTSAQEADAVAALRLEQSKLDELSARLDSLENALDVGK